MYSTIVLDGEYILLRDCSCESVYRRDTPINRIVYRDLKPENSGFDVRGDIKLFDLGLATELYPHLEVEEGLYQLTGYTGSLRYMAPEVRWSELYNLKADAYSFGLVFWEICALERPFKSYTRGLMDTKVLKEAGKRPKSKRYWPRRRVWYDMMQICWAHDQANRPDFTTVCELLAAEIDIVCGRVGDGSSTVQHLEGRRSLNSIVARKTSSNGTRGSSMWQSLVRTRSSMARSSMRGSGFGRNSRVSLTSMSSSIKKLSIASNTTSAKNGGTKQ